MSETRVPAQPDRSKPWHWSLRNWLAIVGWEIDLDNPQSSQQVVPFAKIEHEWYVAVKAAWHRGEAVHLNAVWDFNQIARTPSAWRWRFEPTLPLGIRNGSWSWKN